MKPAYPLLPSIEAFGASLLSSGDLDPLYIALARSPLSRPQLRRWLFAYWCCYHAGASSWISEQPDYWGALYAMAENVQPTPLGGRWPRGHERRHFRGKAATDAVNHYRSQFEPERVVEWIEEAGPKFTLIRARVLQLPQFGPWIAFKVGDMLERVMGVPIDFSNADVLMFKQPYNSALMVWNSSLTGSSIVFEKRAVELTAQILIGHFQNVAAPPRYDRPVNIQEVETILCKWKSHLSGSYPVGLDSRELRHGLLEWAGVSPTAQHLFEVAP